MKTALKPDKNAAITQRFIHKKKPGPIKAQAPIFLIPMRRVTCIPLSDEAFLFSGPVFWLVLRFSGLPKRQLSGPYDAETVSDVSEGLTVMGSLPILTGFPITPLLGAP
jgi:hypothetical protein